MKHHRYAWLESADSNHTEQFDRRQPMKVSLGSIVVMGLILLVVAFIFGMAAGYAASSDRITQQANSADVISAAPNPPIIENASVELAKEFCA